MSAAWLKSNRNSALDCRAGKRDIPVQADSKTYQLAILVEHRIVEVAAGGQRVSQDIHQRPQLARLRAKLFTTAPVEQCTDQQVANDPCDETSHDGENGFLSHDRNAGKPYLSYVGEGENGAADGTGC
jgi:hypothetical protein